MAAREVKGAIHVHSDYSDGSGTVEEIIEAAQAAKLDFLIITDHDTIGAARDGYAGRHGDVLVVVGGEVSPPRRGHCLTLGDVDITGFRWMSEKHYLHKLRRDGADIYIAHPEGRRKPTFGIKLKQWHVWESEHFAGIEIWSYMHDWVENVKALTLPLYYFAPDRAIDGPNRRVLGLWDRLNLHRRVAGIGALDAHAVRMGFGAFVAFRYEDLFRTILTHARVEAWGGSSAEDTARLRQALREARSFVAYDWLGPSDGFEFSGEGGIGMGDRAALGGGVRLHAALAAEGEMRFMHDGRCAAATTAREAEFAAEEPGVYRVEAYLRGRPWIFSNPIVLSQEASSG
jgi:hypothetical protein